LYYDSTFTRKLLHKLNYSVFTICFKLISVRFKTEKEQYLLIIRISMSQGGHHILLFNHERTILCSRLLGIQLACISASERLNLNYFCQSGFRALHMLEQIYIRFEKKCRVQNSMFFAFDNDIWRLWITEPIRQLDRLPFYLNYPWDPLYIVFANRNMKIRAYTNHNHIRLKDLEHYIC
jgi:hypothetical protein